MKKDFMVRRMVISLILGLAAGLSSIIIMGNSLSNLFTTPVNPYSWELLASGLAIGFFVAIVGVITRHPVFGFKMYIIRGVAIGVCIGILVGITTFFNNSNAWNMFWIIVLFGALYGAIIDVIATKFAGQGTRLLHSRNE